MSNSINNNTIMRLLQAHVAFYLGSRILSIFMGLYIWSITKDFSAIATYYIVFYISHCIFFTIAGYFVEKGYANETKRIGLVCMTLFFLGLYIFQEQMIDYLPLVAIALSIGNALYWMSYHVQNFDITTKGNRGHFSGAERAIKIGISLLVPIIGGFVIVQFGYGILFMIGAISQLTAALLSKLDYESPPSTTLHVRTSLQEIRGNKDLSKTLIASVFANMGYLRSLSNVILVYLLVVLGSELEVGGWITIFSVFSVIAVYFFGRLVPYRMYKSTTVGFGTLLIVAILSVTFFPSLIVFIIFGIVKEIIEPILGIPRRVYTLNVLEQIKNFNSHRTELLIIREWGSIGVGGIISYIPFYFLTDLSGTALQGMLLLFAVATLLSVYFIATIQTDLAKA